MSEVRGSPWRLAAALPSVPCQQPPGSRTPRGGRGLALARGTLAWRVARRAMPTLLIPQGLTCAAIAMSPLTELPEGVHMGSVRAHALLCALLLRKKDTGKCEENFRQMLGLPTADRIRSLPDVPRARGMHPVRMPGEA